MTALFLDCNEQLAPVFARVHRPDDPPIAVNMEPYDRAAIPQLLGGHDICLDDHSYLPTEVVAQCRALKHVVFLGTGAASYMDIAALKARGVTVHTIKGYGDTAVAEHAIALMWAACRDLARMDRDIRAGTWDQREGVQLLGKILGVIGIGGIGREVARIARGMGMEVIAWNRTAHADLGVPLVTIDDLLARSDVVSHEPGAQRGDAQFPRRGAHCAHEARRHPGQHGARRPGRRRRAGDGTPDRRHSPCRARRVPCRAA